MNWRESTMSSRGVQGESDDVQVRGLMVWDMSLCLVEEPYWKSKNVCIGGRMRASWPLKGKVYGFWGMKYPQYSLSNIEAGAVAKQYKCRPQKTAWGNIKIYHRVRWGNQRKHSRIITSIIMNAIGLLLVCVDAEVPDQHRQMQVAMRVLPYPITYVYSIYTNHTMICVLIQDMKAWRSMARLFENVPCFSNDR